MIVAFLVIITVILSYSANFVAIVILSIFLLRRSFVCVHTWAWIIPIIKRYSFLGLVRLSKGHFRLGSICIACSYSIRRFLILMLIPWHIRYIDERFLFTVFFGIDGLLLFDLFFFHRIDYFRENVSVWEKRIVHINSNIIQVYMWWIILDILFSRTSSLASPQLSSLKYRCCCFLRKHRRSELWEPDSEEYGSARIELLGLLG